MSWILFIRTKFQSFANTHPYCSVYLKKKLFEVWIETTKLLWISLTLKIRTHARIDRSDSIKLRQLESPYIQVNKKNIKLRHGGPPVSPFASNAFSLITALRISFRYSLLVRIILSVFSFRYSPARILLPFRWVGFKIVCGAHSDMPSAMWNWSVIALFFYSMIFFIVFWYEWMKYVSNNTFTYIMFAFSVKYIWNFQKLYFISTEKISQFVYINYCEAYLLWSMMWISSVIHHFHGYQWFANLTKPSFHIFFNLT